MHTVYLSRIRALKKYKNMGINRILFFIAAEYGLIKNNEIMYKRLYREVLKPWIDANCDHRMSYKEYSRLRIHNNGRVPKYAACYLFEFYRIMISFPIQPCLKKLNNITTYSDYTMHFEKEKIAEAIIILGEANIPLGEMIEREFRTFLTSLNDLDERVSHESERKAYNDEW